MLFIQQHVSWYWFGQCQLTLLQTVPQCGLGKTRTLHIGNWNVASQFWSQPFRQSSSSWKPQSSFWSKLPAKCQSYWYLSCYWCWGSITLMITSMFFFVSFLFLPFLLFLTFKRGVKRCFIFCLCIPVKLFLMQLSTLLWYCLLLKFCDLQVSVYTLDLPKVCPTV